MSIVAPQQARARQEELGQFFTPAPVAEFMASMFVALPSCVRLLDAGAGGGALTLAFVSRCCKMRNAVQAIEATLHELDDTILDSLEETMRECERLCRDAGIRFTFSIRAGNFIQEISSALSDELFGAPPPVFDAAIANPPYRKIHSDSLERRALQSVGIETSNLYTGFVALIHRLLAPGGQIVAITPRSFCNGPYFRPFREDFLAHLQLRRLHVFDSRRAAFRSDGVLQENIIFHATKGPRQPKELTISSSSGESGAEVVETVVPFSDIVHHGDAQRFIHIPSNHDCDDAKETLAGLNTPLAALGITVSTGPVVDFRLKDALRQTPGPDTVPLLYPCHFNGGTVHWPKPEARKPNAILDNPQTHPWLIPAGVYVLTKRFTSKEERRRLVACLLFPEQAPGDWLGLENHLNYFHAQGRSLDRDLAKGLFLYLNCTAVDRYFRRFSGHTQVNATDLRSLPYPTHVALSAMGRELTTLQLTQGEIDRIVAAHLHASQQTQS